MSLSVLTVGDAPTPRSTPLPVEGAAKARLEHMFKAHHELIWRTLRRLGCPPDQAADTTQQAYLIAAERLSAIREGSERAFLFSTAIGLARTSFRRAKRSQLEADMDLHADLGRHNEQFTDRVSAVELMDRIFVDTDETLVTVFVLFELEGLSAPEIAEMVGIPVGTVASRLRRARATFRAAARRLEILHRGGQKP